jgi:hypothetical protein
MRASSYAKAIVALAVVMLSTFGLPLASVAAPTNCGSSGTNFEGNQSYPSGTFINGIEAVLKLRNWGYCTSVSHTDSEWVMIAPDGSDSSQNGWVQVGYQATAGFFQYFWQVNDGQGPCCDAGAGWGSPNVGDEHTFRVERDTPTGCSSPSGHCFVLTVDGDKCHQENGQQVCMITNFDPENKWSSGTRSIASAETPYPGSDVPGYVGSVTHWTHLTEKDGSWTTRPLSRVSPSCPYYHQDVISQAAFDTWTDPLSHNSSCS